MGRLLDEISEPEPEGTRFPPAWYHEPADMEHVTWLNDESERCTARVAKLKDQLYPELTRKQWELVSRLVIQMQYRAVAQRMIMCCCGSSCENPEMGLSAITL
jgi:hypothetical protein